MKRPIHSRLGTDLSRTADPTTTWPVIVAVLALVTAGVGVSEAAERLVSERAERGGERRSAAGPISQILTQSYDRNTLAEIIGHSARKADPVAPEKPRRARVDVGTLRRVERFQHLIDRYAERLGLEPNLVKAVIYAESGGNPDAVSAQGAAGLMQIMPATAAELDLEDVFDPEQNIESGTRYLSAMMDRFHAPELALWAYNAGPQSVVRDHMPDETQRYVPKVMQIRRYLEKATRASKRGRNTR